VTGSGVADAARRFATVSPRFAPDIVVLALVPGDDVSRSDDAPVPPPPLRGADRLFLTSYHLRNRLAGNAAPAQDVARIVAETQRLAQVVRDGRRRLAIVLFHDGRSAAGQQLDTAIVEAFARTDVPVLRLADQLKAFSPRDLTVDQLDQHPNQVAHGLAARALSPFLRNNFFVAPDDSTARPPATSPRR
jgi:hypothetical protein